MIDNVQTSPLCMPVLPSLLFISPCSPCKYEAKRNYWHFCFAQNKTENSKKKKNWTTTDSHTLTSRVKGNKTGNKKNRLAKKSMPKWVSTLVLIALSMGLLLFSGGFSIASSTVVFFRLSPGRWLSTERLLLFLGFVRVRLLAADYKY